MFAMRRWRVVWPHQWVRLNPIAGTLCLALGAFAVALLINLLLGQSGLSRVFLVAVLITAVTYGLWPSLFASLICALIYDFFFIPPIYSLTIASTQDAINLVLFAITAVIVSTLAARVRRYAVVADKRALTAEKLAAFNRSVSAGVTLQEVLDAATEQISTLLGRPVALIFPEAGEVTIKARYPDDAVPDAGCLQAIGAWWTTLPTGTGPTGTGPTGTGPTGTGADRFVRGTWQFRPLQTSGQPIGIVGIQVLRGQTDIDVDPLLDALVEQTALAIERLALREDLENARLHTETERLRSTLLASISHDLRNPLASIVGSASGLDRQWNKLPDEAKVTLVRTIRSEAERLDVFIANLLDITRIEAGVVKPRHDPIYLSDVLGAAISQATRVLAEHRLAIDTPEDLPLIEADAALLQQVLYNVIENAAKYSPQGSLIRIAAHAQDQAIHIRVLDEGPGIPQAEMQLVFGKFYRATNVAQQNGTGLGLAICRGFLEAMRGTIEVANRDGRHGTVVALTLPVASQQAFRELEIT
jgi:two-component system, OmpR family, sensor histidine kinase KdpD